MRKVGDTTEIVGFSFGAATVHDYLFGILDGMYSKPERLSMAFLIQPALNEMDNVVLTRRWHGGPMGGTMVWVPLHGEFSPPTKLDARALMDVGVKLADINDPNAGKPEVCAPFVGCHHLPVTVKTYVGGQVDHAKHFGKGGDCEGYDFDHCTHSQRADEVMNWLFKVGGIADFGN